MSMLFVDSFDHMGTGASMENKWVGLSGTRNPQTSIKRTGTHALFTNGAIETPPWIVPASASGIVSAAHYYTPAPSSFTDMFEVWENGTQHLLLAINLTGQIRLQHGGGAIIATSSAGAVVPANWHRIEFKWTIDNSAGAYEVRVDGINVLSGSGVDTQNGGTAAWTKVRVRGVGSSYYDDFVLQDTAGSAPYNDFLGDVRVNCVIASAGDGTHADFTPSTGTDNGAMVDETDPNEDTDYNTGTTAGHKDTYNFAAIGTSGATIYGVQLVNWQKKTDAGVLTTRGITRIGGTVYNGATISPTTGYIGRPQMWQVSPATSAAWTESEIDGAEFGMERVS